MRRGFMGALLMTMLAGPVSGQDGLPGFLLDERPASVDIFDPRRTRDVAVPDDIPIFQGTKPDAQLVAIIDSGVLSRHPWLAPIIVEERSFVGSDPEDKIGHGTAVALRFLSGLAQAERQLGRSAPPVGALSPIRMMSLKVTETGAIAVDPVIRAIAYAAERGAATVNLSLGFEETALSSADRRRLCGAISGAGDVLFFAAAGNQPGVRVLPAACRASNLIAVKATDSPSGPVGQLSAPGSWRPVSASARLGAAFTAALEQGDQAQARAILSQMQSLLGPSLTTSLAEADLLVRSRDREGLKAHAASIDPAFARDPRYRFLEAVAAFQAGDFSEALSGFQAARLGLPEFAPARYNLAISLLALGRTELALQELRDLESMAPDFPGLGEAIRRASAARAP